MILPKCGMITFSTDGEEVDETLCGNESKYKYKNSNDHCICQPCFDSLDADIQADYQYMGMLR